MLLVENKMRIVNGLIFGLSFAIIFQCTNLSCCLSAVFTNCLLITVDILEENTVDAIP